MDTDFYQHLISDSSLSYYPNNVISEFTTKLSQEVNLPGQWKVALCNISYHKTWGNITTLDDGSCGLKVFWKTDGPKGVLLPLLKISAALEPGMYSSPESLINAIYTKFERLKRFDSNSSVQGTWFQLKDILDITHNARSNKLTFAMKSNPYSCAALTLNFSQTLLDILGHREYLDTPTGNIRDNSLKLALQHENGVPRTKTLSTIMNLNAGIHNIFCYSDLVKNVRVGDTQAPLLRIIPVHTGSDGEYVSETFEDRQYLPVALHTFNTIRVLLGDRLGRRIKFSHGSAPVILLLHFKRIP